jgi:hypothetical protein
VKIAHFGTFDIESYGDLLFPLILERRLAGLGAEITHFSPVGGRPYWKDCVPSVPVGEIFESGKNFDGVIVGGGDIIQGVIASTKVYLEITLQVYSTDLGMISFCRELIYVNAELGNREII